MPIILIGLGYSKACQGRLLLDMAFFRMRRHPHLPPFDDFKIAPVPPGLPSTSTHFTLGAYGILQPAQLCLPSPFRCLPIK